MFALFFLIFLFSNASHAQHKHSNENFNPTLENRSCDAELESADHTFLTRVQIATRSGLSDTKISEMVFRSLSESRGSQDRKEMLASLAWQRIVQEKRNQQLQELELVKNPSLELLKSHGLKFRDGQFKFTDFSFNKLISDATLQAALIDLFPDAQENLKNYVQSNGRSALYILGEVKVPGLNQTITLEEHGNLLREKIHVLGESIKSFVQASKNQAAPWNLFVAGFNAAWLGKNGPGEKSLKANGSADHMIAQFLDLRRVYGMSREDVNLYLEKIHTAFNLSNDQLDKGVTGVKKMVAATIMAPVAYPIVALASTSSLVVGGASALISTGFAAKEVYDRQRANPELSSLCAVGQKIIQKGPGIFASSISSVGVVGLLGKMGSLTWKARLSILGVAGVVTPFGVRAQQNHADKKMTESFEGKESIKLLSDQIGVENLSPEIRKGRKLDEVVKQIESISGRRATAAEIKGLKEFLDQQDFSYQGDKNETNP